MVEGEGTLASWGPQNTLPRDSKEALIQHFAFDRMF